MKKGGKLKKGGIVYSRFPDNLKACVGEGGRKREGGGGGVLEMSEHAGSTNVERYKIEKKSDSAKIKK